MKKNKEKTKKEKTKKINKIEIFIV